MLLRNHEKNIKPLIKLEPLWSNSLEMSSQTHKACFTDALGIPWCNELDNENEPFYYEHINENLQQSTATILPVSQSLSRLFCFIVHAGLCACVHTCVESQGQPHCNSSGDTRCVWGIQQLSQAQNLTTGSEGSQGPQGTCMSPPPQLWYYHREPPHPPWLVWFNVMTSTFIHIAKHDRVSLLRWPSRTLLYICTTFSAPISWWTFGRFPFLKRV